MVLFLIGVSYEKQLCLFFKMLIIGYKILNINDLQNN